MGMQVMAMDADEVVVGDELWVFKIDNDEDDADEWHGGCAGEFADVLGIKIDESMNVAEIWHTAPNDATITKVSPVAADRQVVIMRHKE